MAESIIVTGHTQVKINGTVACETDDGNDIRIKVFKAQRKVHTNLSGPELWEFIIRLGLRAIITIPAQKIDEAIVGPVLGNGTTEGVTGQLGTNEVSFTLTISPGNGLGYQFPLTFAVDSYEVSKFGYEPKITMLTFEAQSDPTVAVAGTASLYSRV